MDDETRLWLWILIAALQIIFIIWAYTDAVRKVGKNGKLSGVTPGQWVILLIILWWLALISYLLVCRDETKRQPDNSIKPPKKDRKKANKRN